MADKRRKQQVKIGEVRLIGYMLYDQFVDIKATDDDREWKMLEATTVEFLDRVRRWRNHQPLPHIDPEPNKWEHRRSIRVKPEKE